MNAPIRTATTWRVALTAAVLVAAVLAVPALASSAEAPMVSGVWARSTAKGQTASAAYMVIQGMGTADRLVAAAAPTSVAMMTQLHKTVMGADGKMTMRLVKSITVPATGKVTLKPGGLHVMLMDLRKPLAAGSSIKLTLTFAKAGKVTVTAKVRKAGSMDMGSTHMGG